MPPKKGKPKKTETDEERAARLEAEAAAAEEGSHRREEAARLALREKQRREQGYAHMNGIKIHNQWRRIMRMAKTEELRQEIEILSQAHERNVDRKDSIIQMLDRDLEDAEEQFGNAHRGHLQVMDQLLDLQYQRMQALQQQFAANLAALQTEFEAEKGDIIAAHTRQKKDMADMMEAMEKEFEEAEGEARQEFESAREEIKNRNSEEYNVLKISLEGQIEELERTFEGAHQAYLQNTEQRTGAFKALTKSDASAARIIEKRMRKLLHLQEALTHWRTKIASNSRDWEERNRALRAEKDSMARHYHALKANMDRFRAQQAERLKQLSIESAAAEAALQNKLEAAERILKLGELCRKLETEQEKVLPFCSVEEAVPLSGERALVVYDPVAARKTLDEAAAEEGEAQAALFQREAFTSHALDAQGRPVAQENYLDNFFKRYNKVFLDKTAIDRERARLEQENGELRRLLKQYLDGISVTPEVMNNPANPLLVVNQRLQLALSERNKTLKNLANVQNVPQAAAVAAAKKQTIPVQHLVVPAMARA
ncbi:hypothetical protein WJX72_003464 [[Myrmecia] bisecta]|uniref:Dynein regulatory complex subunit 2 n=1 Tax=[Myrmecia] bisecta TaxID=41462 RepID=A0AAW1Q6Y0_9CHLO